MLSAMVDENGWLIPYESYLRANSYRPQLQTVQEIVDPLRYARPELMERYWLIAGGVLDEASLERYNRQGWELRAADVPPIPAWLGEHPPLITVFAEDGEIAVYGALDLHLEYEDEDQARRSMGPPGEKWYRYSRDGQLLGESGPQGWDVWGGWIRLYFADFDETLTEVLDQSLSTTRDGPFIVCTRALENYNPYTPLSEREPPEILAAFTYRGERLDLAAPLPEIDSELCSPLHRDWLESIYAAQVRLGLTDPAEKSPWLGREGGPVIVDPAPRPPKQIATIWNGRSQDCVVIRPLDDPGNPYAGQYREWDRWCYENIGKQNPEHIRIREQQNTELNRKLAEYREKGETPPADLFEQYWGIPVDPEDAWKTFTLNVDANGFLKPQVNPSPVLPTDPFDWSHGREGPFNTSAGGIMPEGMSAELADAQWRSNVATDPEIPAWLAAAPPCAATCGPSGDWITLGALGSLAWLQALEPAEVREEHPQLQLHRYSAAGDLLEVGAPGVEDWPLLYTPGLADELAPYRADPDISVSLVYCFYRICRLEDLPPNSIGGGRMLGEKLALFDWQGHALDLQQTPQWDGFTGRQFSGEDLKRIYDTQQEMKD